MQPIISLPNKRIGSIDILRGAVMVLMALDHTRDYFTNASYDPLDLSQTTPQLFLTRWITHFCAPVFVFLAGTSAYLSKVRRGSTKSMSWFLFTRGLWLVFIELTIVNWSWTFDITIYNFFLQVIWAIGLSMMALSLLIYLKPLHVGIVGLSIILLHNSLDGIHAESLGSFGTVWKILHEQGFIPWGINRGVFVAYPVLPWIGVMACGYAFGMVYQRPIEKRIKILFVLGGVCFLLFLILRGFNIYGNPTPRHSYDVWWKTVLNFMDCRKYPPSLLYVLMTIGPAFWILGLLEKVKNKFSDVLTVYGNVPFFYYVLHIPLIHIIALWVAWIGKYSTDTLIGLNLFQPNPNWGFGLGVVYLVWIIVIIILYFPCKWYMNVKKKKKNWWLSYL